MPAGASAAEAVHQHRHERARNRRLAEEHGADDGRQALRRDALRQVADRPHCDGPQEVFFVQLRREHHDRDPRFPGTHLGRRDDPAAREVDVDEAEVRLQAAHPLDELCRARHLATENDALVLERDPDPVDRRRVVSGDEHARRGLTAEGGLDSGHADSCQGNGRRPEVPEEGRCRNIK